MTPPPITDIADWIAGDAAAAYRAVQWCEEADAAQDECPNRWCVRYHYALGQLHALEARDGRTVPR